MNIKKIIECQKHPEKKNSLKMYICVYCKKVDLYVYIDDGHTPVDIRCDRCGNRTYESPETILQPTRIWYRPEDENALQPMAVRAVELLRKDHGKDFDHITDERLEANILDDYIRYYKSGGLFAKNINTKENTDDS